MTNELNIERVDELPQVPLGETLDDPPQSLGPLSEVLAGLREGPPPAEEQEKREVRARLFGSERAGIAVGRYQVGETLGAGGMGEVFTGLDPQLDRPVALKLLHPDPRHDTERSRARMIREAKTLARLSHPNVVQVYEVGEADGRVYIAMELIRGTDLGRWQKEGRHGWRTVLTYYLEAGRGLRAVHEAGLVHRDFKPTNVLLGVDGRVCVADFGLARHASSPASDSGLHADFETTLRSTPGSGPRSSQAASEAGPRSPASSSGPSAAGSRTSLAGSGSLARLTRTGRVAGTPAYMAPEQLRVAEIDARTDQFGFCVALYEGLYGRRPFRGKTLGALLVAHRAGPEPPPRSAAVPRRLWTILRRGLATEPADRFESMDALLQALDPVRARRRLVSIAGVVLAVPAIAMGVAYGGTPDPCPRPSVRSLGWDDDARTTVLAAYEASGLADARTARDTVITRVDDTMTELADARVSACEATHVQHAQSAAMLDLRMLCLQRTSDRVSGLVRAIEAADADGLDRLVDAVESLPSPSVCGPEQLVTAATVPATAELTAEVARARAAIADARASHDLGDDARAKQQLDELEPQVLALRHPPLMAELRLTQGLVARYFGKPTEAAALLLEGAELAEGSRSDLLAAEIWDELTFLAREELSVTEVDAWLPRARAAVTRLGSPPPMRTSIELHEAKRAVLEDDLDRAQTLLEEVVRQRAEQRLPLERTKALEALVHVHRLTDEPLRALERLEEIEGIQRQLLGPRHRKLGDTAYNRGTILVALGRWEEARSSLRTAMETWTERYGPQHLDLALVHIAMQSIELNAGSVDAALRHAEDALRIREVHLPEDHPEVANAHMAVGVARMLRDEPEAAVRAYTTAEQGLRAASGEDDVMVALARANLAEAELATGRVDEARAHVDAATRVLQRSIPDHPANALPLKVRGKLALLEGDATAAVEHLQQALARLESADTVERLEHGDVLLALSAALDAAGQPGPSQQQLAAAERVYEAGSGDVCEQGLARARRLRTNTSSH